MKQYLDTMKDVLENGDPRPDRTGVGNRASWVRVLRFDFADGFPIVTTKFVPFKLVKAELLWFLTGSSNVKELQALGCHIWDANAEAPYWKPKAKFDGDLGRIYGVQWRKWRSYGGIEIDQLGEVIERIKKDPFDRRLVVTAWNPAELGLMALPPCHMIFQFDVSSKGELSLNMVQRSCDMFLGVPFNISSYALLLAMVAQVTGLKPKEVVVTLNNAHIYNNHVDQVREQLDRNPFSLPKLWLNPDVKSIDDFKMDDIKLIGYKHHPAIKGDMAV
ncbi:MAG: thymidylate synthase [Parcubacteria group bacterium Gr01-1014_19]|nr:MAG: thymidylate synthase [Parcubacteria group bacterium Gr01-1014_19]